MSHIQIHQSINQSLALLFEVYELIETEVTSFLSEKLHFRQNYFPCEEILLFHKVSSSSFLGPK